MSKKAQETRLFPDQGNEAPGIELWGLERFAGQELDGPEPDAALIESVKRLGLLQPVLVVDGRLSDGRRRIKAWRKARPEEPIPVRCYSGDYVAEVVTVQTNLLRKANPVSEYLAFKALTSKGLTDEKAAAELGIPLSVLRSRMTLAFLIEGLFEPTRAGQIAYSVAHAAAKLPKARQERLLQVYLEEGKLTAEDVRRERTAQREGDVTKALASFDSGISEAEMRHSQAVHSMKAAAVALEGLPAFSGELASLREIIEKVGGDS